MEPADKLRLPRLISDGMVLQREVDIKIWGWTSPFQKVTVCFAGGAYDASASETGRWQVTLPPLEAGGPFRLEVRSCGSAIIVEDILIGDVWVCSGQSNMVIPMARVSDLYADDISDCSNPAVRLFTIPDRYDFKSPQPDVQSGAWEPASPDTILRFTAVGYFFAKTLFDRYHVPVGLINASVGGSPAEAWMSEEALMEFPEHLETACIHKDDALLERISNEDMKRSESWYGFLDGNDQGLKDSRITWYDAGCDDSSWKTMQLPAFFDDEGLCGFNGSVWFRKEIDLPKDMTGMPARLLLGRIVDSDTAYVNGIAVGNTTYQYPPRRYSLDRDILKLGKNVIVIRVVSKIGKGGFIKDKPYRLEAGGRTISLEGEWKYKVGVRADPLPDQTFFQYKPLGLFNGMLAPVVGYPMKGVLWYQGESNTHRPEGYSRLLTALIADWRRKWGQGEFPFFIVQLPNYMPAEDDPAKGNWAVLREEQYKTLTVNNTSMVVTIDLGEWNDLHPLNKKDVGTRLALAARRLAYGENIVSSGPIYKSAEFSGNKAIINFHIMESCLAARDGGGLKHFEIAGPNGVFVYAKAQILGSAKVEVWNDKIQKPVAVRYAWADNPEGANLCNEEGLPASPFRTDA